MTEIQNIQFGSPDHFSQDEATDLVGKFLFEKWSGEELGSRTREPFSRTVFIESLRLIKAEETLIRLVRWRRVEVAVLDTRRGKLFPADLREFDEHREGVRPGERVDRFLQVIFDKTLMAGLSGKLLIEKTGLIQALRQKPLVLVVSGKEVQSPVPELDKSRPFVPRERNNHLRLLRYLFDLAKLDVSKPHKLGAWIESDMNKEISAETIAKMVIAARSVSEPNKAAAKVRKTKNV